MLYAQQRRIMFKNIRGIVLSEEVKGGKKKMKKIKKELADLLGKIKNETFYGEEEKSIHPNIDVSFEYSPGRFCIKNENPSLPNDAFMEMMFSGSYKISSYREKNLLTGAIKDYSQEEIESLEGYGIINNYLKRDPRYVLANSKDHKKIAEGSYTMVIWDESAKELMKLSKDTGGLMVNIMQSAEIHIENNELKRMVVKNNFLKRSGTVEKVFTDITFYKNPA